MFNVPIPDLDLRKVIHTAKRKPMGDTLVGFSTANRKTFMLIQVVITRPTWIHQLTRGAGSHKL